MSGRAELLEKLRRQADFLRSCGADFAVKAAAGPAGPGCGEASGPAPSPEAPEDPEAAFAALEERVRACRRCPLARLRTNAVPGEGNRRAELMFIGEAPGADEDAQGRPFVGRAGKLLRRIIAAMKFREDEVYITNLVKCRPPDNRNPGRDEVEACHPFLTEQIRLIRPRVIVTLGKVPTDFFVPSRLGISALRGTFVEHAGIPVMPTFHPSYLVRNEGNKAIKKLVWDDMQRVMALLGRT